MDLRRALALSALAPHLPPELQRDVLTEALAAVRAIGVFAESARAEALSALAPHLPPSCSTKRSRRRATSTTNVRARRRSARWRRTCHPSCSKMS